MRNIIKISLLVMLFLNACSSDAEVKRDSNKDIFQYENSLIGDNSAVTTIVGQLQHSDEFKEMSLQTDTLPYGITLTYGGIEETRIEKEYKETVIYNATFLFALIDNVDWITFHFEDYEYQITRSKLQRWYDKELSNFTNEEEMRNFVREHLKEESKVNQLLE